MIKITFLGTNGWYTTSTGATSCVFAQTPAAYIIFDAGIGFSRAGGLIKDGRPVYIFISHLHLDHIDGLQTIGKLNLKQGIKIITGPGMKKELESFMRPPFMSDLDKMPSKIEICEVSDFKDFPVESLPLEHGVPATAFRLNIDGKILVYALDTGVCDNLTTISRGADLLITESAFLPGVKPNNKHLTPEDAAGAALAAKVKKLALIHFKADDYTDFKLRDNALAAARQIFPNTIAPRDGDELCV